MKRPRLIVRALIVDGKNVLVNEHAGYFAFFGGRVEKRESARQALARELREELGVSVEVGALLYVVENFFVDGRRRIHELGLYYLAKAPRVGFTPEKGMAPFWLPIEKAASSPLRPRALRERLAADLALSQSSLVPAPIELLEVDRAKFPEVG